MLCFLGRMKFKHIIESHIIYTYIRFFLKLGKYHQHYTKWNFATIAIIVDHLRYFYYCDKHFLIIKSFTILTIFNIKE